MRLSQVRTEIDDAIVGILIALLQLRICDSKVVRTQTRRTCGWYYTRRHRPLSDAPTTS